MLERSDKIHTYNRTFAFCVIPMIILNILELIGTFWAIRSGIIGSNSFFIVVSCLVILKVIANCIFLFKKAYCNEALIFEFFVCNTLYWIFILFLVFTLLM